MTAGLLFAALGLGAVAGLLVFAGLQGLGVHAPLAAAASGAAGALSASAVACRQLSVPGADGLDWARRRHGG